MQFISYLLFKFCSLSSAYEWQGHSKQMLPVSVEVEKRRLQVFDRSGSIHRSLNLGNQDCLDVLLANDRHNKALMLKVPKEYDLVSSWGLIPQPNTLTVHILCFK